MKRSRWTPDSPHKAVHLALASATLLSLSAAPSLAAGSMTADATPSSSGVYVTILSPNPGTALSGAAKVEITAYYESSFGVSSIDLFIDGRRMATQRLNSPEGRGEISFLVDSKELQGGEHTIVVRATATDAEVASARTLLNVPADSGSSNYAQESAPAMSNDLNGSATSATDASSGPSLSVTNPIPDSTVSGIVRINVNATDPSGKSPYVSLFVDHAFKTLRNFPPYSFDWDTTRLPNGFHTIEVLGYNDAQQVGQASPIRVMVNNPGGRTFERHDLMDEPTLSGSPAALVAQRPVALRSTANRPKVVAERSSVRKGLPLLAHAVRKSIASLISRADKLASLGAPTLPAVSFAAYDSPIAPMIEDRPIAASTDATIVEKPAMKLTVKAVVRRSIKITDSGRPTLAAATVMPFTGEPHTPLAVKLDKLATSDLAELEYSDISAPISAPSVALRPLPESAIKLPASPSLLATPNHKPHMQIASAETGLNASATGDGAVSMPKLDIQRIESRATQQMPAIKSSVVALSRLSEADMSNIRGEYVVVVDDQRVELDRPLQDRGSVLFTPFRQIFESQGGQLSWNNEKRQVHAVNADTDILVTIGSKHATINNQSVRMSGTPYLYNNRTMLPLDFVGAALNARVSYDGATGHLLIESR